MNNLNNTELNSWYEENIGEFDQNQAEIIEVLKENYLVNNIGDIKIRMEHAEEENEQLKIELRSVVLSNIDLRTEVHELLHNLNTQTISTPRKTTFKITLGGWFFTNLNTIFIIILIIVSLVPIYLGSREPIITETTEVPGLGCDVRKGNEVEEVGLDLYKYSADSAIPGKKSLECVSGTYRIKNLKTK